MSARTRITLAFSAGVAAVLLTVGVFVYVRTGTDLVESVDAGLRSRADVLTAEVRADGVQVPNVEAGLIEADEAFAQIAASDGTVLRSSRIVAGASLLPPGTVRGLDRARLFDRIVPRIDDVTRVLAVPVSHGGERYVVIVGASLQDRRDQLVQLAATLGIGGVIALAILSLGGWVVVGSSLRRALERERRFVDEASHELRTPISVLRGRLENALHRPRSPEELEGVLRRSLSEAEALSRLADDLLVLARSNDGKVPIHRDQVRLADLIDAAASAHAAVAEAGGVRLEVEAVEGSDRLDPVRVRQVLDNLLDNAIRHTPPGRIVRVSTSREDGSIAIRVEDEGEGFAPELLGRAFEPFTRGSSATTGPGSGLGLAIVRAVARAHGGDASAENRPRRGAVVVVTLRT